MYVKGEIFKTKRLSEKELHKHHVHAATQIADRRHAVGYFSVPIV